METAEVPTRLTWCRPGTLPAVEAARLPVLDVTPPNQTASIS